MKMFIYITTTFVVAFLLGFITCRVDLAFSKTGAVLSEDVTLYNGRERIAIVHKGTILMKNKYIPEYQMSFHLYKTQTQIIKLKEMYYRDTPASGALMSRPEGASSTNESAE